MCSLTLAINIISKSHCFLFLIYLTIWISYNSHRLFISLVFSYFPNLSKTPWFLWNTIPWYHWELKSLYINILNIEDIPHNFRYPCRYCWYPLISITSLISWLDIMISLIYFNILNIYDILDKFRYTWYPWHPLI